MNKSKNVTMKNAVKTSVALMLSAFLSIQGIAPVLASEEELLIEDNLSEDLSDMDTEPEESSFVEDDLETDISEEEYDEVDSLIVNDTLNDENILSDEEYEISEEIDEAGISAEAFDVLYEVQNNAVNNVLSADNTEEMGSDENVIDDADNTGNISLVGGGADLGSGKCGDNLTWTLDCEGTLYISGSGPMQDYLTVRTPWEDLKTSIWNVVIGTGVTSIGHCAFYDCGNLSNVTIPEGVTSIGYQAFYCCPKLKNIAIPSSITKIWDMALASCDSLLSITVDSSNEAYLSEDGVLFNKSMTELIQYPCAKSGDYVLPLSVTKIFSLDKPEASAFMGCSNLTSVTISGNIASIPSFAFAGCSSLESVTICDGVTSIGYDAFGNCTNISHIAIPSSVNTISPLAFKTCSSLTQIEFKGDAPVFGESCLFEVNATAYYPANNSSWTEDKRQNYGGNINWAIRNEDSVTEYYEGKCGDNVNWTLNSEGVLTISGTGKMWTLNGGERYSWFNYEEEIKVVEINLGVTNIGDRAFSGFENLTTVKIPESVKTIGTWAFAHCNSLTTIEISDGVTSIGLGAFASCIKLCSIRIPETVNNIEAEAFTTCKGLISITIPKSVTIIKGATFSGCSNLREVMILSDLTSIDYDAFHGCSSLETITIPDSVKDLGFSAFLGCSSLKMMVIPEGVTKIGFTAFYGCSSLKTIVIPESVTSISPEAFQNCTGLETITIPKSVTEIGYSAFQNCTSLTEIEIPENVVNLGKDIFKGCMNLTSINVLENNSKYSSVDGVLFNKDKSILIEYPAGKPDYYNIPTSVTRIEEGAFALCSNLKSVKLPEGLLAIGKMAFEGTGLNEATIPRSVVSIENCAFKSCIGLEKIMFSGNAPEFGSNYIVGNNHFLDMTATIYYPADNPTWTEEVRQNYGGNITWVAYNPAADPEDSVAAEEVTNKINTLVSNVSLSNKTSIEEARKAYNSLTDAQKALIDPAVLQKLTDAESALKAAEEKAAKEASDKAAAKAAADKINALAGSISTSDKAAIEAARKAYESLTAEQKALIDASVLKKLTDSETALKKAEEALAPTDKPEVVPTATPIPTPTPSPSVTPIPTATPTPTAAPTPVHHVHEWSDWALTTEPTVMAEGVETRTCECGETETRPVSKLEPTISLNFTGTLPLKQKQTFKGAVISELANGDSVKKVASSNTKIVKASFKKGILTLKAQKKAGTAKITVTLASGLKKTFKVKVQKALVKTKKIVVLSKKVRLKKRGKFDLQTQILPISSTQKITYQTSNKKIVTVKNGVILAGKKSGKATITVKSGSKKVKINVIVK